ncbi:MAG TPA: DoxX family protein [Thermoleophilaceae bacterium]|nr:DoxX family protein [Thermoleophilaceae bacterium]
MDLRRPVVRAVIGGLFIGHGTQKLFGWFGGHGPEGTGQFFESAGIRPGRRNAIVAGGGEALGGALLALGFLTPLAGAVLSSVMITAIRHVHGAKGPWVTEGGYEYNAVMLATVFALVEAGPGPLSLDRRLGTERSGSGWAVAQLVAGAAGSAAVSQLAQREAEAGQPEPEPAEQVTEVAEAPGSGGASG